MALTLQGHLHLPTDNTLYTRIYAAYMTGDRLCCQLRLPWKGQAAAVEAYVIEVTAGPDVRVTFALADS